MARCHCCLKEVPISVCYECWRVDQQEIGRLRNEIERHLDDKTFLLSIIHKYTRGAGNLTIPEMKRLEKLERDSS